MPPRLFQIFEQGRDISHVKTKPRLTGKTWPVKRLAVPGPSAYSSVDAGRPGTPSEGWIYLMAESRGAKVARFNLSWLVAGEPTGDGEIPAWAKP